MASKSFTQIAVLGLYTETPLHCGAESATGYVDLPIQRERHTAYPVIPGSTLKGVLKDEMTSRDDKLGHYFGTSDDEARTTRPGEVSFGDGVIVAFPVRSTDGPFAWVTCPFALERALRALGATHDVKNPEPGGAWAASEGEALLEELLVRRTKREDLFAKGGPLVRLLDLVPASGGFDYTRSVFLERLLVLNDAEFQELVETGTEVLTRIKLTALGTTTNLKEGEHPDIKGEDRKGNMFVEEVVPPETLFCAVLRAPQNSRFADEAIPSVIRLGGDETIGRGLTHVTPVTATPVKGE